MLPHFLSSPPTGSAIQPPGGGELNLAGLSVRGSAFLQSCGGARAIRFDQSLADKL